MWGPPLDPGGQVLVLLTVCNIEIRYLLVLLSSDYIEQTMGCILLFFVARCSIVYFGGII